MAVVSMMKMSGDTDELAAKLATDHRTSAVSSRPGTEVSARSSPARTTESSRSISGRTMRVAHAMAEEPAVLEALPSGGFPPPAFEGYEVIEMTILPAAVRG